MLFIVRTDINNSRINLDFLKSKYDMSKENAIKVRGANGERERERERVKAHR